MRPKTDLLSIIDKAIAVFVIIFLLSLSNSIFVNQLGYYGAILLFLIRWAVVKDNPFSKSGLELAFIWFIIAELISAFLSADQAHAFNNVLKRVLLLPVVYVMIASVRNTKTGKRYFTLYIAGTVISILIYLYFAAQHYIEDLYGITQSGPSIFQYPITASEIISFTVIFMFAFFVNGRSNIKYKLLYGSAFILSLAALLSTYKRTGWMGAVFGVITILLLKKQYKSLVVLAGIVIVLAFFEEDISRINIYSNSQNQLNLEKAIDTDGRVYDVMIDENKLYISDYQNGLITFEDDKFIPLINTPAPIVSFSKIDQNKYVARLSDTRILLYEKSETGFNQIEEIVPPGFTTAADIYNNNIFILDSDSGLTIYKQESSYQNPVRYPDYKKFTRIFVDSMFLVIASPDSGFRAIKHINAELKDEIFSGINEKINFTFYKSNYVFTDDGKIFKVFRINNDLLKLIDSTQSFGNITSALEYDDKYMFFAAGGTVSTIKLADDKLKILSQQNLAYTPNTVKFINNKFYMTYVKPSRLLSIFDPYNQTNMSRFALWSAGFKIWKDYPLFGVGDIDLAEYYKEYKNPYDKEIQGHMHNNFVHVLVTLGLFGLLAVLFIFYRILKINFKIINETKEVPFVSSYALGAIGTFCGFLFSGLTELNFWDHEITTLIWFVFGLNVALYNSAKPEVEKLLVKEKPEA